MVADRPIIVVAVIFPIRILNLEAGTVSKVSIVPFSFSPVKSSMAGYIHPMKQNIMKI